LPGDKIGAIAIAAITFAIISRAGSVKICMPKIGAFQEDEARLDRVMTIEKMSTPCFTVLRLAGEIDLHSSEQMRASLKSCLDELAAVLLLDFKGVRYIDSSGLATLIEYFRESSKFHGKFAIFGLERKVAALFELVRLDQLFVIAKDEAEALARLGVSQ
jgi:anti-sigma B factor antagonist